MGAAHQFCAHHDGVIDVFQVREADVFIAFLHYGPPSPSTGLASDPPDVSSTAHVCCTMSLGDATSATLTPCMNGRRHTYGVGFLRRSDRWSSF